MTTSGDGHGGHGRPEDELEEYGGHIQARHGTIPAWLLAVYLVLFVWALYYAYVFWGGLGPGLDYTVK
jgi:hypothetical protein